MKDYTPYSSKKLWLEISSNIKIYPQQEAQSLAKMIIDKVLGIHFTNIIADIPITNFTEKHYKKIQEIIVRINQSEPIQYILEEAYFYDLKFYVNKHVLIPRPETEELVRNIISDYENIPNLKILDIGCGSGCIPVTLAKHLISPQVYALDISKDALSVAKQNATHHGVNIHFIEADILSNQLPLNENFNIIISNPPYVLSSEKKLMSDNVLLHEPHSALFVTDEKPLIFYENIYRHASQLLHHKGALYFEINPLLSAEFENLANTYGFRQNALIKDIQEKHRFFKSVFNKSNI